MLIGLLITQLTQHLLAHLLFTKIFFLEKPFTFLWCFSSISARITLAWSVQQSQVCWLGSFLTVPADQQETLWPPQSSYRPHPLFILKFNDEFVGWSTKMLKVNSCPLFHQVWKPSLLQYEVSL